MPGLRTISWRRAALFGAIWTVNAVAIAVGVVLLSPRGAVATTIAEWTCLTILFGFPIVAGLVHRSLRVPAMALAWAGILGITVAIIALVNMPRVDHDEQFRRQRSGEQPAPTTHTPP